MDLPRRSLGHVGHGRLCHQVSPSGVHPIEPVNPARDISAPRSGKVGRAGHRTQPRGLGSRDTGSGTGQKGHRQGGPFDGHPGARSAGLPADAVAELVAGGKDATTVYSMGEGQDVYLVMSKQFIAKRGIDLNADLQTKVSKLQGAAFGNPSLGGLGELRTRWILKKGGLGNNDATMVRIGGGFGGLIAAVEQGQVDGYTGPPASPQEAVLRGQSVILVRPGELKDYSRILHSGLAAAKGWAEKNTDTLKRFAGAIDRGKQLIRSDFEAAVAEMRNEFPQMRIEALREGLEHYSQNFGLNGRMDLQNWQDTVGFLKEAGVAKGEMDAAEGIYWTNKYLP